MRHHEIIIIDKYYLFVPHMNIVGTILIFTPVILLVGQERTFSASLKSIIQAI